MILPARMIGRSINVGSVPVSVYTSASAISAISCVLATDKGQLVVTSVNLDHYSYLQEYALSLARSDTSRQSWMNLLDGRPVSLALRLIVGERVPVVPGSDLLPAILQACEEGSWTVGFCGGTTEMLAELTTKLERRHKTLVVAGTWAPARSTLSSASKSVELSKQIERTGADVLILGLGKPIQECWAAEFGGLTGAKVVACFGAAAEFYAGYQRRAPRILQTMGVEWLHRLASNPRRMWRRYLVKNPLSLVRLTSQLLSQRVRERVRNEHC